MSRSKSLWLAIAVDVEGGVLIDAWDGQEELVKLPGETGGSLYPGKTNDGRSSTDYRRVDFPDLDWISPVTYVGVQTISSRPCLVFAKEAMTAWIDLETRMPLLWKRKDESRIFEELSSPAGGLVLPPEIANLSTALNRDREKLKILPPRGG